MRVWTRAPVPLRAAAVIVSGVLWLGDVAPAQVVPSERLIGLLELPGVLGINECPPYEPADVGLYALPGGPTVGTLRADRDVPCAGFVVSEPPAAGPSPRLPTLEVSYEGPAAIVVEQLGRWFRLRLQSGSAWVHAGAADEFHSIERLLLRDALTFITDASDGVLLDAPAVTRVRARLEAKDEVEVRAVQEVRDELWVLVDVLSHSRCGWPDEPTVTMSGWMRAYGASGEPAIWFYSRGC